MIYELAGAVGVNPDPLTLRELLWMAEGRSGAEWARFSALMALTANIHRDPKHSTAFAPGDFNPVTLNKRKQNIILILII